jgi:predicted nucleic-acid-binding Zn-ribbon protein
MKNGICLKCKSTNVKRLETNDEQEGARSPLMLKMHAKPDAWIFKGTSYYNMYAIGCMKCGYVELYMET